MIKENEHKLKIGDKIYNFKFTNQTVFEIDEKFGNFADVINGLMQGQNLYSNAVRILSCCCIDTNKVFNKMTREYEQEKVDLNVDFLINNLTSEQITLVLVDFVLNLYFEYTGIKQMIENEKETDTDKKKEN